MEEIDEVVNQAATNQLLDKVAAYLHLKNDAAIARTLELAAPVVSKLRHGRLGITPAIVVKIHESTGWPVRDIKADMNMRCLTQKVMPLQ